MAASQDISRPDPARRTVVAAVGAAGLAAAVTACGGSDDSGSDTGSGTGSPTEGGAGTPTGDASKETGGGTEKPGGGGTALARTADIPEGGGKIFKEAKVVVTQPTAGEFKAFSATCTHQGCLVGSVSGGTINCPCHGSKFAVADGAVENGPATRPLPAERIEVSGEEIKLL